MRARDAVTERINRQVHRFPKLDLTPPDYRDADPREAGLAMAIEHAVMRRWLTLVAVLESRLTRPWAEVESKLQGVLLVGAAQILFMDRVPDHAAINEAVEWAKGNIRPKAGGFVNAVLRKVAGLKREEGEAIGALDLSRDELPLGDGRVWRLTEPVFDAAPIRRLAQQTSSPESLLSHWMATQGEERTRRLAHHSLVAAPIIVHSVGAARVGADSHVIAHAEPGFFVFSGDREALTALLRENMDAIVQDPTSAAAAAASAGTLPMRAMIIDACAGRGTKTRQLAAMHPHARIVATDADESRLATLREQFRGHARVQVVEYGTLREFQEQADLVLLDVPCSNTGVLARRVEAKYRFSPAATASLLDAQRQIIADSIPLLARDGRILYSTCSIEAVENSAQADWVCKWHRMRIAAQRLTMPEGLPGEPASVYRDGGYAALLVK